VPRRVMTSRGSIMLQGQQLLWRGRHPTKRARGLDRAPTGDATPAEEVATGCCRGAITGAETNVAHWLSPRPALCHRQWPGGSSGLRGHADHGSRRGCFNLLTSLGPSGRNDPTDPLRKELHEEQNTQDRVAGAAVWTFGEAQVSQPQNAVGQMAVGTEDIEGGEMHTQKQRNHFDELVDVLS